VPIDDETLTGATSGATGVVEDAFPRLDVTKSILKNQGFEASGSYYTFDAWTDYESGSSTVNDETSETNNGVHSCRLDIDSSNTAAYVYQKCKLEPGKKYCLSFWYKNSESGKTARMWVSPTVGGIWLDTDGTWATVTPTVSIPNSTEWAHFGMVFSAHASYRLYTIQLMNNSAASSSIYFDDVVLTRIDSGYATLSSPTGLDSDSHWGTDEETINGSVSGDGILVMDTAWQYTKGIMYPRSQIVERDGRYWCLEHYYAKFTPQDEDEIVMDLSDAENDIRSED